MTKRHFINLVLLQFTSSNSMTWENVKKNTWKK